MKKTDLALDYLQKNQETFIQQLSEYAKIPGIAFPGFPEQPLIDSANWTAERMRQAGLEGVEILEIQGAPPFVYGEWCHHPNAKTLLLYAHHDVQPPGRKDKWQSPPFEPLQRGNRLYGRGVVDDKAGGMMHLAAVEAYLKTQGELPINIKFIIEGEEEIGSPNLAAFLKQYGEKLKCDVMVLTDTANLQAGLPSVTYCLRGIVDAIVEVKTLDHPVHSGMWGGPGVDALTCLNQILARLHDGQGRINIPKLYSEVPELSQAQKKYLSDLPFDESQFRRELGCVSSLQLGGEAQHSVYERLWFRPALQVIGLDVPSVQATTNQLVESARAKVSLRLAPGMNPIRARRLLCDFLKESPPYHAEVTVQPGAAGEPWYQEPEGAAFEAVRRALSQGFKREPVFIGCGGSIPFVKPLTEQFGGIPALLIGLEDPLCNAHGENESLLLDDWFDGMKSAVYLYAEKF